MTGVFLSKSILRQYPSSGNGLGGRIRTDAFPLLKRALFQLSYASEMYDDKARLSSDLSQGDNPLNFTRDKIIHAFLRNSIVVNIHGTVWRDIKRDGFDWKATICVILVRSRYWFLPKSFGFSVRGRRISRIFPLSNDIIIRAIARLKRDTF